MRDKSHIQYTVYNIQSQRPVNPQNKPNCIKCVNNNIQGYNHKKKTVTLRAVSKLTHLIYVHIHGNEIIYRNIKLR